jgi:hypothetical protein
MDTANMFFLSFKIYEQQTSSITSHHHVGSWEQERTSVFCVFMCVWWCYHCYTSTNWQLEFIPSVCVCVCVCVEFHHFNAMPTTTISLNSHKMRIHEWDSSSSSSKKNQIWNSHNAEDHGEKQLGDTIVIDKNKSRMEFIHTYVQWWPRSWCEPIGKHQ